MWEGGILQEAAHKVNCLCLGVHGLNTWGEVGERHNGDEYMREGDTRELHSTLL